MQTHVSPRRAPLRPRRLPAWLGALTATVLLTSSLSAAAQTTSRTAFVQLFEWRWTDVAKECETHLGPKGFAAVQVSPPSEHNWLASGDGAPFPWWMRYQTVSYSLDRSRSGTRAEFQDMVTRCNAVGVGIYADAVINHMSGGTNGTSSAGHTWSNHNYPGLYSDPDFHSPVCAITNYNDAANVQNCELSGLQDLNTGSSYVRGKIADYLVDLANMGVKGFRVDAAKHISPTDLGAIIDNVNSRLSTRPFWFLEVIGAAGEAVQPNQYFGLSGGQATTIEFAYGPQLYGKFAGGGKLADLKTFGESWGLMPTGKAVIFTDNHDKQRGHAGGGQYLTYHNGSTYDLGNVFMLAWPYGYPVVMSSYAFLTASSYDTSFGPPYNADGSTKGPWAAGATAPACFDQTRGGWVCEHRFRPIANMVGFRNASSTNSQVTDWWDNGNNQIAFGRADKGFVVINNEANALSRSFKTSLAAGSYCDVISGDFSNGSCGGTTITVDATGFATFTVQPFTAAAIHANAKTGGTTPGTTVSTTFQVQGAAPASGEQVYVVGSVASLGAWDPCKAVVLGANGSAYAGVAALPPSTNVQYKFIKYTACTSVTWEGGSNRSLTTSASGTASVCGVFNSTAACAAATGATITFNETASTAVGQNVYVLGSIAALGSWAPASAVPMTVVAGTGSGTTNQWRATLTLPANMTVEYKHIMVDGSGNVVWESGSNRSLTTPAAGASQTVTNTWK